MKVRPGHSSIQNLQMAYILLRVEVKVLTGLCIIAALTGLCQRFFHSIQSYSLKVPRSHPPPASGRLHLLV